MIEGTALKKKRFVQIAGAPTQLAMGVVKRKELHKKYRGSNIIRIYHREALLEVQNPRINFGPTKQILRISNNNKAPPPKHIKLGKIDGPQEGTRK